MLEIFLPSASYTLVETCLRVVTIIDDGLITIIGARLQGWSRNRWLLLRRGFVINPRRGELVRPVLRNDTARYRKTVPFPSEGGTERSYPDD